MSYRCPLPGVNGFKEITKKFYTMMVVRLVQRNVDAPSLKVFKVRLDEAT